MHATHRTRSRTSLPNKGPGGYATRPVTKAPDWHGLVAWDLLFNNLTTGLFLAAALGELAAPEVFLRVAKVAYPLALVLLARRPGLPGARPGRSAAFPSHAPGVQAQLAHVAWGPGA